MDGLTCGNTLRRASTTTPVITVIFESERSRVIEAIKRG